MSGFICAFVALLLPSLPAAAAQVTFVVRPLSMPDSGPVCIVGSHPIIGNWDPGAKILERHADGTWRRTFFLDTGLSLEYKFTRGAWEKEALTPDLVIPGNSILWVNGDTTVSITIAKWKDESPDAKPAIRGQVTGTVITHKDFPGTGVPLRDIHVWLPPGYDSEGSRRYPVLYMHDGRQIFDPRTSTHGVDWQIDEAVTGLLAQGRMKEIIVVGVDNTSDRGAEYADGTRGKAYQNFLVRELKPFIDGRYRTLPDRANTAVMGSSMGGLASFLLAWHYPDVFAKAGCFSSAFLFVDWRDLKNSDWPQTDRPIEIYMDNGGIGLERRLQPGNDLMLEVLRSKGFTLGQNLVWVFDTEAPHNEEAWAKRAWMPLRYFFGAGTQEWIGTLPPPPQPMQANRDREWKERIATETIVLVGLEEELDVDAPADIYIAVWRKLKMNLVAGGYTEDNCFIGTSDAIPESRVLKFFAGLPVNSPPADPPGNLRVKIIKPSSYAACMHRGQYETRNESFEYLREWYLPRSALREARAPLLEWFSEFPSFENVVPIRVMVPIEPPSLSGH